MKKLKVFLIGSKEISVQILEELILQGYDVKGVLSRDSENGMKVWLRELGHRSLKVVAKKNKIPVYENMSVNSDKFINLFSALHIDIVFTVFWGEIIKEKILYLAKIGFFNIHTAYLPYNRGSFPMAWAIINNEKFSGVTIHKITKGVDDGPIVSQQKVKISNDETGQSLYKKVTDAGIKLFKKTLPLFNDLSFKLTPQNEKRATYHSRGYPYGGQLNSFWSDSEKKRFINALNFPPFEKHLPEPPKIIKGEKKYSVRIMLGFDCDRPRGSFIASEKGAKMAQRKLKSLLKINEDLEQLKIPRTYFICGLFLESMFEKFGPEKIIKAFNPNSNLVEIADHTYSHQVMKSIKTRPDKIPLSSKEVINEFKQNTELFKKIFNTNKFEKRGFRSPLGHYNGLKGENKLLDALKKENVLYISSDLRDEKGSLNPKLFTENNVMRQPYRYENGILEIPSIGWQDTAFSGTSKTTVYEKIPNSYSEIINYYTQLFENAKQISEKYKRDIFLGLVLHPYDNSFYNSNGKFFFNLKNIAYKLNCTFHKYENVYKHCF